MINICIYGGENSIFKHWPTAYYKKAKGLVKGQNKPKKNKKTRRVRVKKTRRVKKQEELKNKNYIH